jgi:hypothetical protein
VNYRFTGFLDEIYATLVVRLHHTAPFQQDRLWRYATDFKTNTGKQLGVKLTRRAPGLVELEVYFDPTVAMEEKIIFSKYVHEHLLQNARDVERLRHYVCPKCGTPVGNREVAMKRLNDWLQGGAHAPRVQFSAPSRKTGGGLEDASAAEPDRTRGASGNTRGRVCSPPSIICVGCEQRVPLWDELEQCFASPEIQQRVRDLQEESGQIRSPKFEVRNKSGARNPKHCSLAPRIRYSDFGLPSDFGFRHSDFSHGVPRAAGDPEFRGRGPLDGSARLAQARQRQRQEAGEANRLRRRALRRDERAAVAGAGVAAGLVKGVDGRPGFIRVHPRPSAVKLVPPFQGLRMLMGR